MDPLREFVANVIEEEWFRRTPEKMMSGLKALVGLKKALGFGSASDKIVDDWVTEMEKYYGIDLDADPDGQKIVKDARRLVASRIADITKKALGDEKRVWSYFHGNLINRYRRKLEKLREW